MYIFFFLRDKVNFEGRKEHWREGREKGELRRRGNGLKEILVYEGRRKEEEKMWCE